MSRTSRAPIVVGVDVGGPKKGFHAVACALEGTILSAKHKRSDRRRLLREAGLSVDSLSNIDQVDAALCALTAYHLQAGTFKTYGDSTEASSSCRNYDIAQDFDRKRSTASDRASRSY